MTRQQQVKIRTPVQLSAVDGEGVRRDEEED